MTQDQAGARPDRPAGRSSQEYPSGFGAVPEASGVRFRVFASSELDLELRLLDGAAAGVHRPSRPVEGIAEFVVAGARPGDRYVFVLGGDERPDPASRFQPEGVHGPSEVVDPQPYRWQQTGWTGRDPRELVIYELHVGTFTPEGTFAAAGERLEALRDLGITAVELMPVADFAGDRNWGYDGVCLFAPSRAYGHPDELRAFVDRAHGLGLAVILDVVYNHLGPEGAYLSQFNPAYFTERHETPWGRAINLDGPGSEIVRGFIIDNALHWLREYRLDGLRLDATHALIDDSPTHLVADLVATARQAFPRPLALYGEDHRNLTTFVEPREHGGWDLDGVWADDFHHILRRRVAGDAHGYYQDFEGTPGELERTIRDGWLYSGQYSRNMQEHRGTDPSGVPMRKFVVCVQNHDQVGNRAIGDRLHDRIDAAAWRAVSTLLLTVPMTPLLFMGQEWAASSPFQYFTDLEPELGRLVTEGRRKEFGSFPEFADPEARERIPDPQAPSTFEASRLRWEERGSGGHAASLALYTELLRLRREHAGLAASEETAGDAAVLDRGVLLMRRAADGDRFAVLIHLSEGEAAVTVPGTGDVVLTTEDSRFALDPQPPSIEAQAGGMAVHFRRPGAVIIRHS